MQVTLATMTWTVSFVSSYSYKANTLPDIESEDFIKECIRIHNKFRSEVTPTASDMLYMTWDPALAKIAKAWAKTCQFKHNPQLKSHHSLHPNFTSLGENIWTGSIQLFSESSAISNWYDEIQDYDFNTRRCTKVCGHYTQRRLEPWLSVSSAARAGSSPRSGHRDECTDMQNARVTGHGGVHQSFTGKPGTPRQCDRVLAPESSSLESETCSWGVKPNYSGDPRKLEVPGTWNTC
ncbi:glioma pathogenesis-related protein 1-like [Sciurus carolinensis]|uniref:glioma pathogenesis-related protein 1-like n=1 Tax=Sciurus carolinensis TaxID=30640 RepID=UPI001FB3C4A6|nr:glioma pathogenesis-related protein 1-like [Sciurus carolinensis]